MKTPWTNEQLQILREKSGKLSINKIAKLVDKTPYFVQQKSFDMGIDLAVKNKFGHSQDGCSYKVALPESRWREAETFLVMIAKMKRIIPRNVNPVLSMEDLRESFYRMERLTNG